MEQNYVLTPENVDVISDLVAQFMQDNKLQNRSIIRGRLAVETVLLSWLERVPSGTEICLRMGKRFLRPYVQLFFVGEMTDPFLLQIDKSSYYDSVLQNLGLAVSYEYNGGINFVNINLPLRTLGNLWQILLSICLAFFTYYSLGLCGSDVSAIISNKFLTPLFDSLISFLSAIAAFMIFFNVLYGVISMGNVANLNRSGVKLLRFILGRNTLAIILCMVVCSSVFNVVELQAKITIFDFEMLFALLVSVVPDNLIRPFINGDTLRIIFLAVSSGVILLALGQQTKGIVAFVKEWNIFFSTAINYFCAIVPIIVYLALTSVLLKGILKNTWAVGKILAVVAVVGLIYLILDTALAGLHSGMGIKKYFYNLFPLAKKAFSTGNAAACGSLFDKACQKIGFDRSYYEYSSLGCQILTSTGTVIVLMCTILGFQEFCQKTVSLPEFLVSGVVYLLIAPSTFAIPGGSISVMAILMSQNFLPDYCLAVYIVSNLFFDMFITAINQVSSINNLVNSAYSMGMLGQADDLGLVKKEE